MAAVCFLATAGATALGLLQLARQALVSDKTLWLEARRVARGCRSLIHSVGILYTAAGKLAKEKLYQIDLKEFYFVGTAFVCMPSRKPPGFWVMRQSAPGGQTMFKKALVAAAVIAAMGAGTAAQAATLNYNGDLFSATVTEDTASATSFDYLLTMTMQFSGNSATDEFYGDIIESWSLQLPSAAAVSLVSVNGGSTAGWAWNSTGKADATGCGSGNVNSICVDWGSLGSAEGGSGLTITDPYTATFVARLIFGSASTWDGSGTNFHLLTVRQTTNGCGKDDPSPCWKKDGGLISQNLTNEVPVPGTLGLLGLGLAGLGMVRRKQQA